MDIRCPVRGCINKKEHHQLVCLSHWRMIPPGVQKLVFKLYRNRAGSAEHRSLCFGILHRLNAQDYETWGALCQ